MKSSYIGILAAMAIVACAQTQVDLKSQSKNIDFSNAASVNPFPQGTALPVTCSIGNMFFKTNAPAGSNVYGCAAANTWTIQSGGGAGGSTSGLLGIQSAANVLTMGRNCSVATPCYAQVGSTIFSFASPATATASAGAGTVYVYVDKSGALTVGESAAGAPTMACSSCQLVSGVSAFPADSIPLAVWTASGGTWTTGTDQEAAVSAAPSLVAGSNITLTKSASSVTIAASLGHLPAGAQPTCLASNGGLMWYTAGASGTKDSVQVCAKDATNVFAWRTIY